MGDGRPRLEDTGEVLGHFVVPFADEAHTRGALQEALHRSGIPHTAFTSIAGECDLLLHLQLRDFRLVAELQADVHDTHSHASSWVYAIPYHAENDPAFADGDVEFFIYLRVHRNFHASQGIAGEEILCSAMQDLLTKEPTRLSGRLLYSLGWPDLLVHGRIAQEMGDLRALVMALQGMTFPTQEPTLGTEPTETPIFVKTITLVGLRTSDQRGPEAGPAVTATARRPVVLGRSQPGSVGSAMDALTGVFRIAESKEITSCALDGTFDFLVTTGADEALSIRGLYEAFLSAGSEFAKLGIERTQTHLMTASPEELAELRARKFPLRLPKPPGPLPSRLCACAQEDFAELRLMLQQELVAGELPPPLTRTISHALDMFRHTLRDTNNCCDCVGALRAHAEGLGVLIELARRTRELLRNEKRESKAAARRQAFLANEIAFINLHLAEWCRRAGRVLRERTAGSGARMFLQIDSIVAQRGAVPKVLLIAERLMEDFYSQLSSGLHGTHAGRRRRFAAILEPQGNVTSNQPMGQVAIPLRYAFALHLMLPQLWHEVGQYVFWAEYYLEQERPRSGRPKERRSIEGATLEAFRSAFHLRGDMFADVLVFTFGFHQDSDLFLRYLASLAANVARHDNLHLRSWEKQAVALVNRLLFVAHFKLLRAEMQNRKEEDEEAFLAGCRLVQTGFVAKAAPAVTMLVNYLQDIPGWGDYRIPPDLVDTVAKNCKSRVYKECLEDMAFIAWQVRDIAIPTEQRKASGIDWATIARGELVDITTAEMLTAAYREFFEQELEAQLATPRTGKAPDRREPRPGPRTGEFCKMATLGRSALIHIYRSELAAATGK